MKVAIYCRVSTLEQAEKGFSVDEQQKKLKAFCDINDWDIQGTYIDAGFSGAKTNRPDLQRLIDNINKFDLVLVYKLDRLTRSVKDLLNLLDIFEKNSVSFRSATEVYDTTNAMGRLFVTLVGAMAEWERTTIQERTQMGRRAAASKGLAKTTPPFYYDRINDKFVPNEYAKILRFAVDEVKKGTSVREITRKLNNSNVKSPKSTIWHKSVIHHALMNPVSRGHYQFDDILIKNTHEPIITDDEYEQIKVRIGQRTNSSIVKHHSVFRGKLQCPNCHNRLTLNTTKNTPKNSEPYYAKSYYCDSCKYNKNSWTLYIKESEVLKVFYNYLKQFDLNQYEVKKQKKKNTITVDIDKVMAQRKNYHKLYAKGLMQEEELFELIKETDDAIAQYEKELKSNEPKKELNIKEIKNFKNLLLKGWKTMTVEDKEDFIKMAIKRIDIEFIKGKRGKRPNSLKIKNIEFY